MKPKFNRLVRFLARDGRIYHGEPQLSGPSNDAGTARKALVVAGDIFGAHRVTDECLDIRLLLPPLAPQQVGTVRCVGLNYPAHVEQAGVPRPAFPVLSYRPRTALAGPLDRIRVEPMALETEGLDYGCELVVVVGSKAKDVPESRALHHVLGFAVANGFAHRAWQMQRRGGQWSLGQAFDAWVPYGPAIVTQNVIKDPQELNMHTTVNGEARQRSSTGSMVFSVRNIIASLSRGMTLMPGDLIFTGTPGGVGMNRKPPTWLKHGDVVQVAGTHLGKCTNTIVECKHKRKPL